MRLRLRTGDWRTPEMLMVRASHAVGPQNLSRSGKGAEMR
jgi:hypothetical protein